MKVLSLDLDFITEQYSRFLKRCLDSNHKHDHPNKLWDDFYLNFGNVGDEFKMDYSSLFYFFNIFTKSLTKSKKVIFSHYHDCILQELLNYQNIDLINIDYHHDIFYTPDQSYEVEQLEYVHEGNWIWLLNKKKILNSYDWIRNINSSLFDENIFNLTSHPTFLYNSYLKEEYNFENYEFDLIFVCLSPQYIAPQHWHYFELLKNIYKSFTGENPIINNKRFIKEFDINSNNSGLNCQGV